MIARTTFAVMARFDRWRPGAYLLVAAVAVTATVVGRLPPTGIALMLAALLPVGLVLPLAEEAHHRERALASLALWSFCCCNATMHLAEWTPAVLAAGAILLGILLLPLGFKRRADGAGPVPPLPRRSPWRWVLVLPLVTGLVLLCLPDRPRILQDPGPLVMLPALKGVLGTAILVLATTGRPWTGTVYFLAFIAALGGLRAWGLEGVDGRAVALLLPWYAAALLVQEACRGVGRMPPWLWLGTVLWLVVPGVLVLLLPEDRSTGALAFAVNLALVVPGSLVLTAPRLGKGGRSARAACGLLPAAWRFYARSKLRHDPVFLLLRRERRPWGRVLDAGCGMALGGVVALLRGDATAYRGLDLDATKLAHGRLILAGLGRDLDGTWRLGCAHLPAGLPAEDYDTILLLDVLHYHPREDQLALLAALAGRLAEGGVLSLREGLPADATSSVVRGEAFTTAVGFNPGEGGLHFLPRADFLAMIAEAGLAVENEQEAGGDNVLFRLVAKAD